MTVDLDTTWMEQATCRGVDPALFYPERGAKTAPAKAVCAACPVRDACLDHALATRERDGIWGGTSARERLQLRAATRARHLGRPTRPGPTTRDVAA